MGRLAARGIRIVVLAGFMLVAVWALWRLPQLQLAPSLKTLSTKDALELENSFRLTIAQILGGIFLLTGAIFAWRSLQTGPDVQITNRFSQAVEQLAKQDIEVRLGGIYAL